MARPLPKYLTRDQAERLIAASTIPRDRCAVSLMLGCALRVQEACDLTIENIDFSEKRLLVRAGKNDKDRVVPFSIRTMESIKAYIGDRTEGYVLLPKRGKDDNRPINQRQLQRMIENLRPKADLPDWVHPHSLRHTYAVSSLKAGRKLETVRQTLGHENISTTQIYTTLSLSDIEEDIDEHPIPY